MKKIINFTLCFCLLVLFSFSQTIKKKASADPFIELNHYLNGEIKEGRLIGVHGLVFHQGKVVYDHFYGQRDAESKDAMQGNEEYAIASMTKPIVTAALMTLFEEGKFSLNDPIEKYLPEFQDIKVALDPSLGAKGGLREPKTKITIAQILTHTSGLSHGLTPVKLDQEIGQALFNPTIKDLKTRVKLLATLPLMYEPGTQWNYSFSTDVAARLMEVISGKNASEFLQARIFNPLQMKNTGYNLNPDQQKRMMTIYDFQKDSTLKRAVQQPTTSGNTLFAGISGVFSTTDDYLNFAKMILNKGEWKGKRILKRETVDLMTQDYTANLTRNPIASSNIFKWGNGLYFDEKGYSHLEPGYGFGLGFCILLDPALAGRNSISQGELFWAGYYSTYFFINPTNQVIGLFMTQIGGDSNPYTFYYGDKMREYTYKGVATK